MDMYQKRKVEKAKNSESVTENTSSINWYHGHLAQIQEDQYVNQHLHI